MNKPKYWIALAQAKGIGFAALNEIYDTVTSIGISVEDVFDLTEAEIRKEFSFKESVIAGIIQSKTIIEEIEDDLLNMMEAKITPVLFFEKNYPNLLKQQLGSLAPPILYCLGNTDLFNKKSVAMLGNPSLTPKGEMIAVLSAKILSQHNILITGGLSKGAGVVSHISAIENGGTTIGILPCGLFKFNLNERLKAVYDPDRFLLVSPFYLNEEVSEFNALNRNRLICALSDAVFIIESEKSGIVMEAAKSASKLRKPIYTAEYSEYPESAKGNSQIIEEYSASKVRGRMEGNTVVPNLDSLLATLASKP